MNAEELQKLLDAATPGPWIIGSHDPKRGVWIGGRDNPGGSFVLPYLGIAETINWPSNYQANAALIALAPTLAARVIAMEKVVAALRRCLNYMENTEREFGIQLESGDIARAALAAYAEVSQ